MILTAMVLVEIAKFISDYFRDYDIVCRYGGEEFIVIIPNSTMELVEKRAKTICDDLEKLAS